MWPHWWWWWVGGVCGEEEEEGRGGRWWWWFRQLTARTRLSEHALVCSKFETARPSEQVSGVCATRPHPPGEGQPQGKNRKDACAESTQSGKSRPPPTILHRTLLSSTVATHSTKHRSARCCEHKNCAVSNGKDAVFKLRSVRESIVHLHVENV